jgi:hypothetical protein
MDPCRYTNLLPYPFLQGIRLPSGSSNAPSFSFNEDNRAGWYLPQPGQVSVVTDLKTRLNVSANTVTVGEPSNECALTVYGKSTLNGNVLAEGSVTLKKQCRALESISVGADSNAEYPIHIHTNVNGVSMFCESDIVIFSDERLKRDIQPIENALQKIKQIKGYTFIKQGHEARACGLLAQELQQVLPEAVHTHAHTGLLTIAYDNVISLLVNAINELSKELEEVKKGM